MPAHLDARTRGQSAWDLLTGDLEDDLSLAKGLFAASGLPDFAAECHDARTAVTSSEHSALDLDDGHMHKRRKPNGYHSRIHQESQASDSEQHLRGMSKEAEVFALQGIRISLLNKLAEVCPQLCAVTKENKAHRSLLLGMGQNKDDLKRTVELACLKQYQRDAANSISHAEATAIAAATLANSENSPVDALDSVLERFRYATADRPVETAPPRPSLHFDT